MKTFWLVVGTIAALAIATVSVMVQILVYKGPPGPVPFLTTVFMGAIGGALILALIALLFKGRSYGRFLVVFIIFSIGGLYAGAGKLVEVNKEKEALVDFVTQDGRAQLHAPAAWKFVRPRNPEVGMILVDETGENSVVVTVTPKAGLTGVTFAEVEKDPDDTFFPDQKIERREGPHACTVPGMSACARFDYRLTPKETTVAALAVIAENADAFYVFVGVSTPGSIARHTPTFEKMLSSLKPRVPKAKATDVQPAAPAK